MTAEPAPRPRVPLLERDQVPDEVAALYDQLMHDRGVVPNMFKALANVPALAVAMPALLKPLMGDGALPAAYKELIATRVASLNECNYCVSAHRQLALQRGATPEQIGAIDTFESGPFSPKEKSGFRYAGMLHLSGHAISEQTYRAVRAHFNHQELIELTAVAAAFEFFSRINTALHIPVTPIPENS